MKTPTTIEIGGRRYPWRELLALRKAQREAARESQQPTLFDLKEDTRPPSERSAAGRFTEPSLFGFLE